MEQSDDCVYELEPNCASDGTIDREGPSVNDVCTEEEAGTGRKADYYP